METGNVMLIRKNNNDTYHKLSDFNNKNRSSKGK